MKIVYLGYNSFLQHKRGVENVIDFQSKAYDFETIYYLHWGATTTVYKNNMFVSISIKHCWYWPVILNLILFRIKNNKLIVHSHSPLFSFCSIFQTDILTVHDGLYYLNRSSRNRFSFVFYIIELLVYYRCKMVHFISNYTKKQSLFGNRKNFVIIPNTSHFEPYLGTINLNVNKKNTIDVLIVRSIEERARFDLLLKVAEQLDNGKYKFIVAGKGPLLIHYKNEIQDKKITNIEMLGYIRDNELLNLYFNCDMVMMIAEYGEGFGLPIIEGYLFNKPVIASNRCAIPEVIISKDYLFENNVESIIKSIEYAANNHKENYAEYFEKHFSNSIVLLKFRNLYLNTCS